MSAGFVSVHALQAGYLTLPERFFVSPLDQPESRTTVPSLSFLVQHKDAISGKVVRILFDLGIRQKVEDYAEPIYNHAMTRQPLSGDPSPVNSLALGGLSADDIDFVIFSHLHWDHIGTPSDYQNSTYVIGPGAASLIDGSHRDAVGSHNHFEVGILDMNRVIELSPPAVLKGDVTNGVNGKTPILSDKGSQQLFSRPWLPKGRFEAAMDIFGDGSLYIVHSPGHLDGHINLLCRLKSGKHVYLAGDSIHDARLLTGEKNIAVWTDPENPRAVCCIHKNKELAYKTIKNIREAVKNPGDLIDVEVVFAHDLGWEKAAKANGRFFPGHL